MLSRLIRSNKPNERKRKTLSSQVLEKKQKEKSKNSTKLVRFVLHPYLHDDVFVANEEEQIQVFVNLWKNAKGPTILVVLTTLVSSSKSSSDYYIGGRVTVHKRLKMSLFSCGQVHVGSCKTRIFLPTCGWALASICARRKRKRCRTALGCCSCQPQNTRKGEKGIWLRLYFQSFHRSHILP